MKRMKLLLALAMMPDEAFGWFVGWAMLQNAKHPAPEAYRFPDGLGGFSPESRTAIALMQKAAKEYAEAPE